MNLEIGWRIAGNLVPLGDCVYFQGPAGANVPYLALHLVSWWLDLSTLESFIHRHNTLFEDHNS